VEYSKVLAMDVVKAIGLLEITNRKFACIFMDPPYDKKLLAGTIEKISQNDIIEKKGILVVEHSAGETPPDVIFGFACHDRRDYGAVNFSFYHPADV
ncbi:MAG: RsmD family RNA methyltransferase, partial [Clostridia bacterium]|nr:RsmD family RNA methyltransferase [Clostridia bacterium]